MALIPSGLRPKTRKSAEMSPRSAFELKSSANWRHLVILATSVALILVTSIFVIDDRARSASSTTTLVACANFKTGAMRLLLRGSCSGKYEKTVYWSVKGPRGAQGEVGPTGPTGPAGLTGRDGAQGPSGPTGAPGTQGATGTQGSAGSQGTAGSSGQGSGGAQGLAGRDATDNTNGFVPLSICGASGNSPCVLGAIGPAGGIIALVDYHNEIAGADYVELAPTGWNGTSDDPSAAWCDETSTSVNPAKNSYPYWKGRLLGEGPANTADMLAHCTAGAAVLAHNYTVTHNGVTYSDWGLPSIQALMHMYMDNYGGGAYEAEAYWSSSESSATQAWAEDFSTFDQQTLTKSELHTVRPVRKF